MICESVSADDGGREGKWVALSIAVILLIATILLPHHQVSTTHQALAPHQILIQELEPQELAMIADLRLAHEEIRNIRQDSLELDGVDSWPSISELEEQWLAPFVKDKSWQHKGQHRWLNNDSGAYLGIRQQQQGSASVVLYSLQALPDVWLDFGETARSVSIEGLTDPAALIDAGWKQVVFTAQEENHPH
ncbi:DUF6162 family protein [Photobacterium kasasachensis]|uniref:DUF6162 family protein n=1 Tax=Photobacterium kasasachensis TaxID=2910240 RepID=UPI003D151728